MPFGFSKSHHKIARRRKVGVAVVKDSSRNFCGFPLMFLQHLRLATSNLVCRLDLPRPIIKSLPEDKWARPWARGAFQNLGFYFNISAMTEGSDFKIGRLVGFAKAHHKIRPRKKRRRGSRLGELPKIWGYPFNIYAMVESIDFKFGTQIGWPIRPIITSHK